MKKELKVSMESSYYYDFLSDWLSPRLKGDLTCISLTKYFRRCTNLVEKQTVTIDQTLLLTEMRHDQYCQRVKYNTKAKSDERIRCCL